MIAGPHKLKSSACGCVFLYRKRFSIREIVNGCMSSSSVAIAIVTVNMVFGTVRVDGAGAAELSLNTDFEGVPGRR